MKARLLFIAIGLACCQPAFSQTITLGTANDPCTGGTIFAIPGGSLAVRYGDFQCKYLVSGDGPYSVRLDFLEPCFNPGACSSGQITKAGQRVEVVSIKDGPSAMMDPIAAGATASTIASLTMNAFGSGGAITVSVKTMVRSGVLAAITVTPYQGAGAQLSRQQCIGSSAPGAANGWNCAGIELWTITSGDSVQKFTAMPASGQITRLPPCPSTTACLQPADIGAAQLAIADGPALDIADPRWDTGFGQMYILPKWNPDLYALVCGNTQGCYPMAQELQ